MGAPVILEPRLDCLARPRRRVELVDDGRLLRILEHLVVHVAALPLAARREPLWNRRRESHCGTAAVKNATAASLKDVRLRLPVVGGHAVANSSASVANWFSRCALMNVSILMSCTQLNADLFCSVWPKVVRSMCTSLPSFVLFMPAKPASRHSPMKSSTIFTQPVRRASTSSLAATCAVTMVIAPSSLAGASRIVSLVRLAPRRR